jgi:hypothetical protein
MTENRAQPLTGTEQRLSLAPCTHRQREFIGSDHGATFHRCLLCSAVLISQEGRLWVLAAKAQPPTT